MAKIKKTLNNCYHFNRLLQGMPNTYAFTKGLSEDLVHSYKDKFPIVIARPTIVTAAWKEPFEGNRFYFLS